MTALLVVSSSLRHTAAALLLLRGVRSQISLTLYTYSHILPSTQEEVAEKLDELLSATPVDLQPIPVGIETKR